MAEATCLGAYCLYLAFDDTHFTRWRCRCLVQFGVPETAGELMAALAAMDGTFTRAEAALCADPRRPCGYSVCRTAAVVVRAAQLAGPSAPAMAMASPARATAGIRATRLAFSQQRLFLGAMRAIHRAESAGEPGRREHSTS
jgi:hypothetical protein